MRHRWSNETQVTHIRAKQASKGGRPGTEGGREKSKTDTGGEDGRGRTQEGAHTVIKRHKN